MSAWTRWLTRWGPPALTTSRAERWRVVLGAWLGILCTAWLSAWLAPHSVVWLVAPVGASAVLVFTAPSSPLAQPWPVVAGNTLSALVGWCCVLWLPGPLLAAAVAVAAAIALMMVTRSLHPPGGAVALLVVLMQEQHGSFALFPVLTNSVLLVLMAMLYNKLTRHPYPHPSSVAPTMSATGRIDRADLDAALANYGQVLDVAPDELVQLLRRAQGAAAERLWSTLRCSDIMSTDPVVVDFKRSLGESLDLMKRLNIKALPVVDQAWHVVGIITQTDLLRSAQADAQGFHTQSVGDVMTRQVRVASADSHALDLLPLFSSAGHHHLPIIDHDKRLVGILTQTDLVRALSGVVERPPADTRPSAVA